MRRFALPLLLSAVLAGRATAQSPDSIGRAADSLARESMRRLDSISRDASRSAEEHARWADSVHRAVHDEAVRRARRDPPARWEDSLRFGRRVRVEVAPPHGAGSAPTRREGTFVSLFRDTVLYRPDGVDSVVAVPLGDVRGLWVSGGRVTRAHSAGMGAMVGAAVSGFIAAVVSRRTSRTVADDSFDSPDGGTVWQAAALGAGIGFLLGLRAEGYEEWHRVWPAGGR